ncbi:unnamed protein product [Urochloa humidicola]
MGSHAPPPPCSPELQRERPLEAPPARRFGSMVDVMLRARSVGAPPRVAHAHVAAETMGNRAPLPSSSEIRRARPQEPPPPRRFGSMADVMRRARPVSAPPPVPRACLPAAVYDAVVCDACGSGDREGELLLCDDERCGRGRHTFCLRPFASEIPDSLWFCGPTCGPPARHVVESEFSLVASIFDTSLASAP